VFVRHHLAKYPVDDAFIDKTGEIIHLSDLVRIDAVPAFIYQPDADACSIQVQHGIIWILK